jgi:hypothetical protein
VIFYANCSLCEWEDDPRSLEAAHAEQEQHANSRTHQLAIMKRDRPVSDLTKDDTDG